MVLVVMVLLFWDELIVVDYMMAWVAELGLVMALAVALVVALVVVEMVLAPILSQDRHLVPLFDALLFL